MKKITEVIEFMKINKHSGVWIENGGCKIYKDCCDGYSEQLIISTTMFQFLESCNLLKPNSYSGFKAIRIFESNITKKTKSNEYEKLFLSFKENKRKTLINDIDSINKIISLRYENQTQKNFIQTTDSFGFTNISITPPKNHIAGFVRVGSRDIRYFRWKTKEVIRLLTNELERTKSLLKTEDYSEFISAFDYERSKLPVYMENKLKEISCF